MKVDFYRHSIDETDIAAVGDVLRSVFLTTGPRTGAFEKKFAEFTGRKHVAGVTSCTAALHLALLALGVGPGDEVIVPAMTFYASATPVFYVGATPVLADVCPRTGLIDPEAVSRAITDRTKAVIPVHLYGVMADMRALRTICDARGLFLIEDAAHCIEGSRDGARPGDLGTVVCHSFYATKNLACGEGGAVSSDDPSVIEKVRTLRQHGMSKSAAERYTGAYKHWDMVELGWKYNMFDIQAALLLNQMDRLEGLHARRKAVAERYDSAFSGVSGVDVPETRGESARHLYTIWVNPERRDDILHALQAAEIGVAVNYRAIHTLTWLKNRLGLEDADFPNALSIGNRTISLPFYPGLTPESQDYVIENVIRIVGQFS